VCFIAEITASRKTNVVGFSKTAAKVRVRVDRADGSTRLPLANEANLRIGFLAEAEDLHRGRLAL
jgi:hypothetical protein